MTSFPECNVILQDYLRKIRITQVTCCRGVAYDIACSLPLNQEHNCIEGLALKIRIIDYGKLAASAVLPAMASDHARRILCASVGKRIRILFTDGLRESVEVDSVDEEGFVYRGPEPSTYARNFELVTPNPACYWTPFGAIASLESST